MDLASAVQFLLAYEASLKLAPGQKPPPPSPSLFAQLSDAVAAIDQDLKKKKEDLRLPDLPLSVWSDWPLCCGVELTSKELKAARSITPSLLRQRGFLSLFLALHSCAEAKIKRAAYLAFMLLRILERLLSNDKDPASFPSAHLAARVGHRLINADDTLDFQADSLGDRLATIWQSCSRAPINILISASIDANRVMPVVPHKSAGLSLAKELAVMLDALCAAQQGSEEWKDASPRGLSNRLPFLLGLHLAFSLEMVLTGMKQTAADWTYHNCIYDEAAALPAYDPVLLLQSFFRLIDSGIGRGSMSLVHDDEWSDFLDTCRGFLWAPLSHRGPLGKLRPLDGYALMRLGLEDILTRGEEVLPSDFVGFAVHALQSGMVQPELILRARPQLLELIVESLAQGGDSITIAQLRTIPFLPQLTYSPPVNFHLRKFFSRSGCLQAVREALVHKPDNWRRELIRLLGPRAAQSDVRGFPLWEQNKVLAYLSDALDGTRDTAREAPAFPFMTTAYACDFVIRDLTPKILCKTRCAEPLLQYLSELTEEIAVSQRPHALYGIVAVVGLGRACLAFSNTVARALQDIREAGRTIEVPKGPEGAGVSGDGTEGKILRDHLVKMARELSLLRRRVLRELLPVAEAREAALWEGVRVEEVVAALHS